MGCPSRGKYCHNCITWLVFCFSENELILNQLNQNQRMLQVCRLSLNQETLYQCVSVKMYKCCLFVF